MNNYSVHTHNLTRMFGSFCAVNNLCLQVHPGEVFGFLGANGAGKTTAIRMLTGLLKPSSGQATVAGYNVFTQSEQIKKVIGYMSQKFSLYQDLTVKENIRFYGGVYGLNRGQIKAKTQQLLQQLSLTTFASRLTGALPVGIRQRLALGCALLHNPQIVFLDEPTSGVDPQIRRNFWEVIYQLAAAGKTVFVTTHFMDEAEYCHRVSIMRDGQVIALDKPQQLKKQYQLNSMQQVFLHLVSTKEGTHEEL